MTGKPIRVLVIDDSAVVRQVLSDIIDGDPRMEVMAVANDPFIAAEQIKSERPDVITLDVEMPRMDGITFLRRLMSQHPIPVVICSSLVSDGSVTLSSALDAGVVDIVCKPQVNVKGFLEESAIRIRDAIYAASKARLHLLQGSASTRSTTADAGIAKPPASVRALARTTETVVAIAASTGGTEALRVVLEALPGDCPPIVIVQHMPAGFTKAFAERLDNICAITVREARDNDRLLRGHALIAPGERHLLLNRSGANYMVQVRDGPLVSRHKPSADVLFRSVSRYAGSNAVGVIMTGMGNDGSRGLKEMRDVGARTIGQNEATSVVYGMPKEALAAGAVEDEVPLNRIAPSILRLSQWSGT